jgi:tripartite-type tricarboxylate transporter receptor subunit TctC
MKSLNAYTLGKALVCLSAILAWPLASHAADAYPTQSIKLVIPFAPGGSTDNIGRLLATYLSKRLGQAVVPENRPGAGGQIGIRYATKAPADGYTLVIAGADGLAMGPSLKRQKPYDAMKDLTPVSLVANSPLVFTANSKFKGKTLRDLVNLARINPGTITYGSAGVGTALHLGVELLESDTDTQMLHVPYQGGAPMMQALISDQVDFVLTSPDFVVRYASSGRVHAIAQADVKRHPLLPEIPTTAEQGMKDLVITSWFGILGPANMPKAIVDRLDTEIDAITRDPTFQKQLVQMGSQVQYMNPSQFHEYIGTEIKRWEGVIEKARIPPQD